MIPYETYKNLFGTSPYIIMILIGIIFSYYIVLKESERLKLNTHKIIIIYFSTFIFSFISSKLFFFLGPWNQSGDISALFIRGTEGNVFYGGLLTEFIVIIVMSKLFKMNTWQVLDIAALVNSVGMFFGRIGCFFGGCCYGKASTAWFALKYGTRGIFPTQIISSFYNLGIFIYLTKKKYKKKFDGQIFLLYLMLYSGSRFFVEFLRASNHYYFGLSTSQYISIILFAIGVFFYWKKSSR